MRFYLKRWLMFFFILISRANFQIPVQWFPIMPPPIPIVQPAIPIIVRLPNLDDQSTTSTTTTTTTERNIEQGILVPLPMPIPVPVHVPYPLPVAIRPGRFPNKTTTRPSCPPCICQPSCTPAFYSYCSPCHQKCRCQSNDRPTQGNHYAVPMPMLPGMPAPIIMVPFPPQIQKNYQCDYSSSNCSEEYRRNFQYSSDKRNTRKRLINKRKQRLTRRNLKSMKSNDDSNYVRPILTYISDNGNIKIKRRLSDSDAAELLNDKESHGSDIFEKVQTATNENRHKQQRVVIGKVKNRQYVLNDGSNEESLEARKKKFVFRPPKNRKISNFSVSFQIA